MSYHENWQKQWRSPEPKRSYDAIIVGGGGHGLATAYYLAKEHGMRNIAVVERGWLGGGNTARNTTIVRSSTCGTTPRTCTRRRCSYGKACRRISTTTPCSASAAS